MPSLTPIASTPTLYIYLVETFLSTISMDFSLLPPLLGSIHCSLWCPMGLYSTLYWASPQEKGGRKPWTHVAPTSVLCLLIMYLWLACLWYIALHIMRLLCYKPWWPMLIFSCPLSSIPLSTALRQRRFVVASSECSRRRGSDFSGQC